MPANLHMSTCIPTTVCNSTFKGFSKRSKSEDRKYPKRKCLYFSYMEVRIYV